MPQTGLATETAATRFTGTIMRSEEAFRGCFISRDRQVGAKRAVQIVADAGVVALREIHVPPPDIVIKDLSAVSSDRGTLYTAGSFSPWGWKIELPIELAHSIYGQLGIDDKTRMHHGKLRDDSKQIVRHVMASYAATVIHECRHCEQVHRVSIYAIGRGEERKEWDPGKVDSFLPFYFKTFSDRSKSWRKPTAPPAMAGVKGILLHHQLRHQGLIQGQLALTDDERAEAFTWYHSMYGDLSGSEQTKRGTGDLRTYKSIPEEDDAYALQNYVEGFLYGDWNLDWADKDKYQLAHLNLADAGQ